MQDGRKELNTLLHENQNQFVYLLLAVNVSAIGFAINRTIDKQINWNELLLALSVLCWGISFLSGCKYIEIKSQIILGNLQMFEQLKKPILLKQHLDKLSETAVTKYHRLKYYLYAGVILFLIWHVFEIIKN